MEEVDGERATWTNTAHGRFSPKITSTLAGVEVSGLLKDDDVSKGKSFDSHSVKAGEARSVPG